MNRQFVILVLSATVASALPSVGPDYRRPDVAVPSEYRDTDQVPFTAASPADDVVRGQWWTIYGDPVLDDLVTRSLAANQDLRAAAARVDEARALAGIARGNAWPQLSVGGELTREQTSKTTDVVFPATLTTNYRVPFVASWEIDVFGRVRRLSEGARADAAAMLATFEATRLALAAEVASSYFALRGADQEIDLLRETKKLREQALSLVTTRFHSGSAAEVDVARAQVEFATTQADLAELQRSRAQLQNALAVLVGEPASQFAVTTTAHPITAPTVPAGLPAQLLERRPDVAAAERRLIAANARIGVAKAAFFPAISLTGNAGYASGDIDKLFQSDSRIWSVMPSVYLPIFQGGRNRANLARARAAFEGSVASYRQATLIAFREVQDALSATRWLQEQASAQLSALAAAQRASALAEVRYNAGYVSYLEVIDAQRTALATQRRSVRVEVDRLNASVALIKALGGGWGSPHLVAAR